MQEDSEAENEPQNATEEEAALSLVDDPSETDAVDDEEAGLPLIIDTEEDRMDVLGQAPTSEVEGLSFRVTRRSRLIYGILVTLAIVFLLVQPPNGADPGRSTLKEPLFDVNAPPGREEQVSRVRVSAPRRQRSRSSKRAAANATELPFPVIEADEEIPQGKVFLAEHAADVLECRDSVINFVINATDAKDECNGLKKAFDKTCNSDSVEEIRASADPQHTSADPHAASADPHVSADPQQRRLLVMRKKKREWKLRLYQFARSLRRFAAARLQTRKDVLFFAEDEVMGDAWEEAMYQVENDYDFVVHEHARRALLGDAETVAHIESPRIQPVNESEALQNATEPPKPVEKKPQKPLTSLSLPTKNEHVSDQMLSETLMLSKEKDVEAAIKIASNATNATLNEAQSDAVKSSQAVHDTTAVVSAVLNDPTSVEARTCCASILNVYHEHCDTTDADDISDSNLFFIIFIIAFCGVVKSLIRHFKIRWLPEAAGCILVGVAFGGVLSFIPHHNFMHSFDGDWFLRIMVPPIVFEAALSIDKRSFHRHIVPIIIYAVIGTLFATGLTAFIVHKGTSLLGGLCETIPYVESLTFGALISSIDPIAVLSVLSNLGMTDTDTIYVVIFGESLLNDGVAIVLFQTLVHFLDESLVIDGDACLYATMHFLVVALGSVFVGFISGMACTLYFYVMNGKQTPLVEVLMFFCWAFVPYYICDGVEWSGIVSIVTTGLILDLYVVGQSNAEDGGTQFVEDGHVVESVSQRKWDRKTLGRRIFSKKGHLSAVARTHVGFVTEILATMMETAIFAYLGFFLFSSRYHWNFWHVAIALIGCCMSRAIMIPLLSSLANWITSMQQNRAANCRGVSRRGGPGVIIDSRMQSILWFAGLRGAMSFALVENIPLYDAVTGEGSRMKAELKAMTSASIIFTVFVLGGCTDYVIEKLGMAPMTKASSSVEMSSLVSRQNGENGEEHSEQIQSAGGSPRTTFRRQRGSSRT